jgi:hypothetical protein
MTRDRVRTMRPGAPPTRLSIVVRRASRLFLSAALLLPLGGCIGAIIGAAAIGAAAGAASSTPRTPATTSATASVAVGAAVQLQYAPPREVELRYIPLADAPVDPGRPSAATASAPAVDSVVRIAEVALVVGRVRRVQGDTAWVAVSEVRSQAQRLAYPLLAQPVHVVTGPDAARLEQLGSRPLSAAVAAALGAAAGIFLLLALCDATNCFQ